MLILLNTQIHGEIKTVAETCLHTKPLDQDQTGVILKRQLKETKEYFLMKKFKKSHQKTRDYKIS